LGADVAIVGAGVSAAAAALTLRGSGLDVVAIGTTPTGRRPGEHLAAGARALLADLGVWEAFERDAHRPAHSTFSAWGTSELHERSFSLQPGGGGWYLDRARFERTLWAGVAPARIARILERVGRARLADGGWELTTRTGRTVPARFVLDCTGRTALVARRLASRIRADRQVAAFDLLTQHDRGVEPTPSVLVEARPDGWWYSTLVPDGRLAVAYFTDADLLPRGLRGDAGRWRALLSRAPLTARRVESAGYAAEGAPAITAACGQRLSTFTGDGWAAAGDAAAAFDPLSSHGITTALWAGREAALAAVAVLVHGDRSRLDAYRDSVERGVGRYHAEHRRMYALETRFRDRPYWRRRARGEQSMQSRGQIS